MNVAEFKVGIFPMWQHLINGRKRLLLLYIGLDSTKSSITYAFGL